MNFYGALIHAVNTMHYNALPRSLVALQHSITKALAHATSFRDKSSRRLICIASWCPENRRGIGMLLTADEASVENRRSGHAQSNTASMMRYRSASLLVSKNRYAFQVYASVQQVNAILHK